MAYTAVASSGTVWAIDADHSEVSFAVRHLMLANVRGSFRRLSGEIMLNESDFSGSTIDVAIDAASIDTRQEQRDAHLRSADFFDAARFPQLHFRSTRIEGDPQAFRVSGELTIRDVTRPVVLAVSETGRGGDPWGGQRIGYRARTKIDRRDFGLTWNQVLETGGIAVGNEIEITIDVETVRA